MTVSGADEKSPRRSAFCRASCFGLTGVDGLQEMEFVKVARTEHGHFFQRGTNLHFCSSVPAVI